MKMPITGYEYDKLTDEEKIKVNEQYNKFRVIDKKVHEFLGHEDWMLWSNLMQQEIASTARWPLEKVKEKQDERITELELKVDVLKKENDIIWKRYIEDVAAEKIKVREAYERWTKYLESRTEENNETNNL
jgi:hypothetical protein